MQNFCQVNSLYLQFEIGVNNKAQPSGGLPINKTYTITPKVYTVGLFRRCT